MLFGGEGVDVPDSVLMVDEAGEGPLGVLGNRVGEEPDGAEVQEILHNCLVIYSDILSGLGDIKDDFLEIF